MSVYEDALSHSSSLKGKASDSNPSMSTMDSDSQSCCEMKNGPEIEPRVLLLQHNRQCSDSGSSCTSPIEIPAFNAKQKCHVEFLLMAGSNGGKSFNRHRYAVSDILHASEDISLAGDASASRSDRCQQGSSRLPHTSFDDSDLSDLDMELEKLNNVDTLLNEDVDNVDDDPGSDSPDAECYQLAGSFTDGIMKRVHRKVSRAADELDHLGAMAHAAVEQAEELVRHVWQFSWKACHFSSLPNWLQDNDFIQSGHRPPLPSFAACFRSIFRIHSETGNIWTHLLGCVAFIAVAIYFVTRPNIEIPVQEKLVFSAFFIGAILCLGMSFAFHTLHCHSEFVGKLFSKLDYCGIALLIMGSFVPWLYYGFYCELQPKIIYLTVVIILGIASFVVSLWEKFGEPRYRWLRAGVFMGFGLSGVIPAIHYCIAEGWIDAYGRSSVGWLVLMGAIYITGALFYALRVPERFFPGKCDIWFQSHQIFHILVIAAAFVHYHGISEMASYRLAVGECSNQFPAAVIF